VKKSSSRTLMGWREIAAYFQLRLPSEPHRSRRGLRTVMRWASKQGLPVTLMRMGARSYAMTSTGICDAWLALQSPAFRKYPRGAQFVRQLRLPLVHTHRDSVDRAELRRAVRSDGGDGLARGRKAFVRTT